MSNHVHCILSTDLSLSDIVRNFKKHTSKLILAEIKEIQESRKECLLLTFKYHAKLNKRVDKYQFWGHENHAVELTSNQMIDSRIEYIHQNLVRAELVDYEYEYVYSSALNFAGNPGLIEIDEL